MFWRGVLGYLPVNIVQGVVGLLTIVLFTRVLEPAQYGVYALAFSVGSLTQTCLLTWTEAAMARFLATRTEDGRLADHFATLYRLWIGAALAVPVACAVVALLPLNPPLKVAVIAALASSLVNSLMKLAQERRRAAGEVSGAALLSMAQTAGGFLVGLALAFAGLGGAAPVLGVGVISALCVALVLPSELKSMTGGRFDKALAKAYAAYGLPVSMSLILALVLASTDRLLLGAFLDEATVGVYHAGYSLGSRTLDVVFIWLGMAGAPALISALERGGQPALTEAAREQAGFMTLLTLPAAVGLALVARPLADLMVGEGLRAGASHVTPWIAASGWLSGVTTYYLLQAFTLARRTPLLIASMSAPALANVILNLILIPRLGLDGALWATTLSYGLGAVAAWALGRRACRLPIPWEVLAKAGGASLVMAACVSVLPSPGGLLELALKAGVGAAVYGALVLGLDVGGLRGKLSLILRRRAHAL
ncbi:MULTISPECIES: lipopolysaccharide biosynthesis protein [unclassified Caulobacter]|uniref:polysaccharide biosynthesis protein HfsF n=1 Tax=unclassified Caulobacter TaxID=2648921 RepID=UPI0006F46DE5|nr:MULTISPECIES: lipopolysaccharide biosynthesis protein [unclassified Caulobacter]KQV56737.1 polysaccharide biosynthesis protein [Caulobacter sp. Root342]KQV72374.1 polysaccharide biosynthesis protein [Caulobacter sp. Root343]